MVLKDHSAVVLLFWYSSSSSSSGCGLSGSSKAVMPTLCKWPGLGGSSSPAGLQCALSLVGARMAMSVTVRTSGVPVLATGNRASRGSVRELSMSLRLLVTFSLCCAAALGVNGISY